MDKKKIMIGIIVLTVVMITGVTYALWQINLSQESENIVSTSCFKVSLKEENPITLNQAYPIREEEGLSLVPFTFTMENICDTNASYQINLEILNSTTLEDFDYLKMSFESIGEIRKPVFLTTKEEVLPTLKDNQGELISKRAYKLETGYLGVGEKRSYEISLWLDENTPAEERYMDKIFQSKISVIATYIKDYDKESPITNIEVTNLSNQIHVDASTSHDNTNVKYYYYSLDGESFIKTKEPEYTFEVGELNYGVATDTIKTLADSLSEEYTVYVKTEDEYGNISEVVTKKVYKDFAYDNTTDNNLRYIGASPNNYVLFNDELWRIIGVMENVKDSTGRANSNLKIIRSSTYKIMQMDSNNAYVWGSASSQKELNTTYYNSLMDTAKKMVSLSIWPMGAQTSLEVGYFTPAISYSMERSGSNPNSAPYWTGNIAFMYASDAGYATSGGSKENRSKCLGYNMTLPNSICTTNNWLHTISGWTISQHVSGCYPRVGMTFVGDCNKNTDVRGAAPALYLAKEVKIIGGIGTQENPFEINL